MRTQFSFKAPRPIAEEAREEETEEDEETEPPVIGLGSTATAAEVAAAQKTNNGLGHFCR